jgi:hypothetical protein
LAGIIAAVDPKIRARFRRIDERLRRSKIPTSAEAIVLTCQEYSDDYIGQQITKLNADSFTDAPLILPLTQTPFFVRGVRCPHC